MTAGAAHKKYDNIILLTAKIFTRNRRDTEREMEGVRERETARRMHVVLQLIGYGNKSVASVGYDDVMAAGPN